MKEDYLPYEFYDKVITDKDRQNLITDLYKLLDVSPEVKALIKNELQRNVINQYLEKSCEFLIKSRCPKKPPKKKKVVEEVIVDENSINKQALNDFFRSC